MNEKQVVEFCIRNNITVNQYFILYLTKRRWEGWRKEYVDYTHIHPWSQEEMLDLLAKKLIIAPYYEPGAPLDPLGISIPEDTKLYLNTDMGEQLWNGYPATFQFSTGNMFVARTGMAKDNLITLYLDKIAHDPEKHEFVMKQLNKYIRLVSAGKINGHKLSDWVLNEIWDTVASIPSDTSSLFKDDV